MNVLVVGGAGYVGGAVTDLLMHSKHNFRVYDSLVYEESYRKDIEFICGDIRDTALLSKHLKWADAVIWLAALVGDGACAINPELTLEINQKTVEWLSQHYDGRILFTSTCSVYGAQDGELTENSPVNPLSAYAVTKYAAEQALSQKNSIQYRLGTLFGVGDNFSRIRLDLVVNVLTLKAATEGVLTVFGGDQFRPLLHVRDTARALFMQIDSTTTGVFNLHRQNVRIVDLAYQVRNHFPDCEVNVTGMLFQDARNYRANSDAARSMLGWQPHCSIDDGIEEIKNLVISKRLKNTSNIRYSNQGFLNKHSQEIFPSIKL